MSRRLSLLGLALLALAASAWAAAPTPPPAEWLLEQVKTLAAPTMEGRGSGTPGGELAAAHVAAVFRTAGLTPAGEAGTFFQSFSVPTGLRHGALNRLALLAPTQTTFELGKDFRPLTVSTSGAAAGEVVFVGYGITATDLGYDDYAGLDVSGKIVLAMSREPRSQDPASPFRRHEARHYTERDYKIVNARHHGAAAILLAPHPAAGDAPLPVPHGQSGEQGVIALAITRALADSLLASAGMRLAELADAIDASLTPRSAPLAGIRLRAEVDLVRERGVARNVVGMLPGTDLALRDQAVVIGAHYDHLGRGGESSLAPDQHGQIHPGADDNASGTAAVMALARAFAAAGGAPRTLVFAAFSGEELGLLGSAEYVRRPAVPLDGTVLMVNLDMVGRMRDRRLYVGGLDTGTGLRALVERLGVERSLSLQPMSAGGFGVSDHTSFYVAGVPVLFFFTGLHGEYHRPTDTWERINAQGLATVAGFVAQVVSEVAAGSPAPAYVKVEAPRVGGGGYGPVLGVVPDFAEGDRPGVRITGVRAGSPADKAGLKAGDIIVKLADVDVKTLEDLTYGLRSRRAGDEVQVVVVRDGREQSVTAVLGDRRERLW